MKYESQGGPGLNQCLGLLNASSQGGDKTYFCWRSWPSSRWRPPTAMPRISRCTCMRVAATR
jgi:hypothetical protein